MNKQFVATRTGLVSFANFVYLIRKEKRSQ